MPQNRKVILYIAMSLDGFIAKSDDNIDFLSVVDQEGEDYGYMKFIETVDTVILGRRTYEKVLSMGYDLPYGDRNVFVLTRNPKPETNKITFYSGNLSNLISGLKKKEGKNIYCDGGAETVYRLLQDNLIDELIVSIIPVLLGDGIRLFKEGFPEQKLQFVQAKSFEKGLVQLHYIRVRN